MGRELRGRPLEPVPWNGLGEEMNLFRVRILIALGDQLSC